jgi:hypothetical protein
MRDLTIKVYKFSELSEEIQLNIWQKSSFSDDFWVYEFRASLRAFADLFSLTACGRTIFDYQTNFFTNIDDISGLRLYKYLVNNYWNDLFKPKFIKSIPRKIYGRQFKLEHKNYSGKDVTFIYSKINRDSDCPLTGVCYDYNVLSPIYAFLKKPYEITFKDLINECLESARIDFEKEDQYYSSFEYFKENQEINGYEYIQDDELI